MEGAGLTDRQGRLTGMTVGVRREGWRGSFAVFTRLLWRVVLDLVDDGEVQPAFLGVATRAAPLLERRQGYETISGWATGVLVERLFPDGPGAAAGLRPGDLLIGAGGRPISWVGRDLSNAIGLRRPGETVALGYVRDGAVSRFMADLAVRPAN